jgi:hypothetical protein
MTSSSTNCWKLKARVSMSTSQPVPDQHQVLLPQLPQRTRRTVSRNFNEMCRRHGKMLTTSSMTLRACFRPCMVQYFLKYRSLRPG